MKLIVAATEIILTIRDPLGFHNLLANTQSLTAVSVRLGFFD